MTDKKHGLSDSFDQLVAGVFIQCVTVRWAGNRGLFWTSPSPDVADPVASTVATY